jgi:hypothetical protein
MQRRTGGQRKLRVEQLEGRAMMAGVVNVSIVDGDVLITGDNAANSIEITNPTSNVDFYRVTGKSNTRITGRTSFNLGDFDDDIRIDMKNGADTVVITGRNSDIGDIDAEGTLQVDTGSGNDTVRLKYFEAITGSIFINMGSNNDTFDAAFVRTDLDFDIDMGTGKDVCTVRHSSVGRDLIVDLQTGADTVTATNVKVWDDLLISNSNETRTREKVKVTLDKFDVDDDLKIDLRFSVDDIKISNSEADDWTVELWSGDDKLFMKNCRRFNTSALDGGTGTDHINYYNLPTTFTIFSFEKKTQSNF